MFASNKVSLREVLIAVGLVAFVFLFFYLLQFSIPDIAGVDGYFHIKFSYLMRKMGFIKSLPWLQFTVHRDYYRDHHFLQHVLYIPFTFGDLLNGAKWTAVVFPTIAIFCIYWLLKECNIKWPFLWAGLALASSQAFLCRMSMPRIQSISLACLILTVYFVLKRKYITLAIFSFFFVWLYDAFIFNFIIALCFFISRYVMKRELNYRVLIYCSAGIAAGIVINPYFPHNISSFIFNLTRTTAPKEVLLVGIEWDPCSTWAFATNCGLALIVFFASTVFALIRGTRLKYDTLGLFFFFLLLLLMYLKSRRWVEYWPPFTVILSAFLMRDVFEYGVRNEKFGIGNTPQSSTRNAYLVMFVVIVILLSFFFPRNFIKARHEITNFSLDKDLFKGAAQWLKENTEPKSVVFNTDWDDFPFIFFYNSENYYIVGLDPTYMYYYDPELYKEWEQISTGEISSPGRTIYETFGAKYVITKNEFNKFLWRADMDVSMALEYQDDYCSVYSIY